MEFVRERLAPAWVPLETGIPLVQAVLLSRCSLRRPGRGVMQDLAFIALTIVVFAVLYLLLKGVER
jgi:hypothetical protein